MMSKNYVTNFRGETYFTPIGKLGIKEEPVTPPLEEDFGDHNRLDDSMNSECEGMKKSLSLNDLTSMTAELKTLGFHNMETRQRRTSSTADVSKMNYIPMAEAIYHYHRDTPERFHSNRRQGFRVSGQIGRLQLTVPQSPMLRCKGRSRPLHIMSQKEREEMEAEEIKKFKIKANPIPKAVLQGSKNLPDVPKKFLTVPMPFNLTDVPKKINPTPVEVPTFKARPAPKHILEKPQVIPKPSIHITNPISPRFHYKPSQCHGNDKNLTEIHAKQNAPLKKPVRHGPVLPEPFSFDKRDNELKKLHEEKIKKLVDEERKQASQFKAQPLPGAVKKRMVSATTKSSSSTTSSDNKENYHKFEARPPTVLYKKPFVPVLKPVQLSKPSQFQLATEKRAAEREIFERNLKSKEEEQELLRQQKEKELQELEERAKTELRAKLVHHPKPVPALDQPFIPEKSEALLTVPETPKFVRRLKQAVNNK